MDYIERCYKSLMRPFPDRPDVTIPGRWYWCVPGAKAVPYPSTFFSLTKADRVTWDRGIGEVFGSNVVIRGVELPQFAGQGVCGSAAVWASGAPFAAMGTLPLDNQGRPLCCPGNGESGQGGISIGGTVQDAATVKETGQGGLSVGGYGIERGVFIERAQGGLSIGGNVKDAWIASETGQGGLSVGGYGIETGFAGERGQGGLRIGGQGLEPSAPRDTGQGGLAVGGYGIEKGVFSERGQGGLSIGGNVKDTAISGEIALGGLSVGGYGLEKGVFIERAQGGLRIGGIVQDAAIAAESSKGGLRIGGTVQDVFPPFETAKGGLSVGGQGTSEVYALSVSCGACTKMPVRWTLTVAGYTGGAAALNGTWTLTFVSGCTWSSPVGANKWTLQLVGSNWQLTGQASTVTSTFATSTTGWNCLAANTLSYSTGTNDTGHPASTTISPA